MTTEMARRAYTPEQKAEAVALHRAGQSIDDVAAALDVSAAVVRTWVLQADMYYAGDPRPAAAPAVTAGTVAITPPPQSLPARRCAACGRGPALQASLRSVTGIVIAFRMGRVNGTFCRDCGTSMARRALNRTLLAGWWGLFAGVANLYAVIVDSVALSRFRRLPAPVGEPALKSQPLAPGKSLFKRAGVYVGSFVMLCSLVVGLAVIGYQSPASRFDNKCVAFSPKRLIAEPTCDATHDGRVIGVVGKRSLCPPATDATLRLKSDSAKMLCIDLDQ